MPRTARIKNEKSIYHIMIRSISEVDLFKNKEDKIEYLSIIKKYIRKYHFKVYVYCLMDNHGHLVIDCNGADISKIMHGINFKYARYYNKKYCRHGHLFQDRFKSKIIDSERYLIALTLYIHNNPKDIKKYKNNVEKYEYSSLKDYNNDINRFHILDKEFIKRILYNNLMSKQENHIDLALKYNNLNNVNIDVDNEDIDPEFENEHNEYRSYRKIIYRNFAPEEVIRYVLNFVNIKSKEFYNKYNRKYTKIKGICCYLICSFCNVKQREICEIFMNITQSRVSKLSEIGLLEISNNIKFGDIMKKFMEQKIA